MSKEPEPTIASKEFEQLVLGCMMFNTDSLNEGVSALEVDDFFFSEHRIIFGVLEDLADQEVIINEVFVIEALKRKNLLADAGGSVYIHEIVIYSECMPSFISAIEQVKDLAIIRKLSDAGKSIYARSLSGKTTGRALLEEWQEKFFKMGESISSRQSVTVKEVLNNQGGKTFLETLKECQETFARTGKPPCREENVKTCFIDLDNVIDGLGASHLIMIGARPGIGKTAFALSLAKNIALEGNIPVGIFSLEMTADELVYRLLSSISQVNGRRVKDGEISREEYQKLEEAAAALADASIIIDDQSSLRVVNLANRARRMRATHKIGLLIIDYLQLLKGSKGSEESRQTEVADISRTLKLLAKELNIPIICLAQLSRKTEERENKRPHISDLRESGALEQDSDLVILLYRKDVYDKYDKPGWCEVIIGKNRHGPIGSVEMAFKSEFGRFDNLSKLP